MLSLLLAVIIAYVTFSTGGLLSGALEHEQIARVAMVSFMMVGVATIAAMMVSSVGKVW